MRISVVTVQVHSDSEADGRRAAERMYGGQLDWILRQAGYWAGMDKYGVEVATVKLQEFEVQR